MVISSGNYGPRRIPRRPLPRSEQDLLRAVSAKRAAADTAEANERVKKAQSKKGKDKKK